MDFNNENGFTPKFNIGDKVYASVRLFESEYKDKVGTIVDIDYDTNTNMHYLVRYDGKDMWVYDESIRLANEENNNKEKEEKEMKSYSVSYSFESDGKKTTGKKYVNGKLVAEKECNCHPEDEFNFNTGMDIVKKRLDAHEKKYLWDTDGEIDYGIVGDKTTLVDKYGRNLFVGDIVTVYDKDGNSLGQEFVCRENGYLDNAAYIMGYSYHINENHVASAYTIELFRPFNYVSNEMYSDIKVVKM